jgi:hypothetical protein
MSNDIAALATKSVELATALANCATRHTGLVATYDAMRGEIVKHNAAGDE